LDGDYQKTAWSCWKVVGCECEEVPAAARILKRRGSQALDFT
jgi:hypothetical protein